MLRGFNTRIRFMRTSSALLTHCMLISSLNRGYSKFISNLGINSIRIILMLNTRFQKKMFSSIPKRKLDEFGQCGNSLRKYLKEDVVDLKDGSKHFPRQVRRAHFTTVLPEPVPSPYMIAASKSCADMLNLDHSEFTSSDFAASFSGNKLIPGLDKPYATVYGCHSHGQWFGQLGDGRALSIGDVYTAQANHIDDLYMSRPAGDRPGREDATQKMQSSGGAITEGQQQRAHNSAHIDAYGDHIVELQLKGCGRSPFSRGFDGRAVLRSSVREFLVSEAMYHLGVPTTRALSIIGTGQTIHRAWYDAKATPPSDGDQTTSTSAPAQTLLADAEPAATRKFAPNMLLAEPGAVLCRVSRSFLRFGQLELFAQRGELEELRQLADFVCFREYPDLLLPRYSLLVSSEKEGGSGSESRSKGEECVSRGVVSKDTSGDGAHMLPLPDQLPPGSVERYIALYRRVAQRTARLVANWLRVGYVQGNMNSDNTLLSGATIDYGPFGWMERYDPQYQPFTSDRRGDFAFSRQPVAMELNVAVLGETAIAPLVRHAYMAQLTAVTAVTTDTNTDTSDTSGTSDTSDNAGAALTRDLDSCLEEVRQIAETDFARYFTEAYQEVKRCKLGLHAFRAESPHTAEKSAGKGMKEVEDTDLLGPDEQLWQDLEGLMAASNCDFTILFRELGAAAELLCSTCATEEEDADNEQSGKSNSASSSSSSSQEALRFVPAATEVSLFPNIEYAAPSNTTASSDVGRRSSSDGSEAEAVGEEDLARRALEILLPAFYDPAMVTSNSTLRGQWLAWLQRYGQRLREDTSSGRLTLKQRRDMQDHANPRYVLRNWMAALAYERAQEGDYSVIEELTALLEHPYADSAEGAVAAPVPAAMAQAATATGVCEQQDKWYRKTPGWARNLPGVAFMS